MRRIFGNRRWKASSFKRLATCKRASIPVIVAMTAIPTMTVAGGSVDFIRQELLRVRLQDTLDRGTLAAASLSQPKSGEATIRDYLRPVEGLEDVQLDVEEEKSLNSRDVRASARVTINSSFLRLIGIDTLDVRAASSAKESKSNIEISLVLDVSGSMAGAKFNALRPAARSFIDQMLTAETRANTSINLVPFAGHVNVSQDVFDALKSVRSHSKSSCIELELPDYGTGLMPFDLRKQVPHFTTNGNTRDDREFKAGAPWCPDESSSAAFLRNDATYLKDRISNFLLYDGTGTAIGMTWGLKALDPVYKGRLGGTFPNRPALFDDPDTRKFIVLMTDGEIVKQERSKDPNVYRAIDGGNNNTTRKDSLGKTEDKTESLKRMMLACKAARDKNILIFVIGFQIKDSVAREIKPCASSSATFYKVDGLDISQAFKSIAASINKLKLTPVS